MSLRTESYAMYYFFHTKPIETYVTVTWLSWVGNFLIAEMLVYIGLGKRILAQINYTVICFVTTKVVMSALFSEISSFYTPPV
jgi:hypothetical protein